jgi:copper transport protein
LILHFPSYQISSSSHRDLPLILILCVTALVGFGTVHSAYGHAFVTDSNPSQSQSVSTSPKLIDVFFSEPVDLRYSSMKVLDSTGKQIDLGQVHYKGSDESSMEVSVPVLKDGTYTVSTNVLSQIDGHVTDNAFVFGVGQAILPANLTSTSPSSTLYLPEAIARFPTLLAQVMIVGAAFANFWIWRPLSNISALTGSISQLKKYVSKNLATYYVIASIILISSNFAILYFQAISINASIIDVLGTKFGTVLVERSVISFILFGISLYEFRQFRKNDSHLYSKLESFGILIIGITLLATTSLIGHGASSQQVVPIIMDFVHNVIASIWIGGTFYLAFILIPKIGETRVDWYYKLSTLSIIIPRHSSLVVTLLGILVITGPFLLYILEDNLTLVIDSLYGIFLVIKLLLAGLMVILGGYSSVVIYNRVISLLKVSPVVNSNPGNDKMPNEESEIEVKATRTIANFRKALVIESILGIALLVSVGLLVNTGIPASEELQNQDQSGNAPTNQIEPYQSTRFVDNNTQVVMSINPLEVGNNNFKITFLDMNGKPIEVQSAGIKYRQLEKSIGPITADLEKQSTGVFSANASFGIPGIWDMEVQGIPVEQNMSSIVASFNNLLVKPNFDGLKFDATNYPISNKTIQPLYPIYDKSRNSIWFGDTIIGSSRIFAFDINTRNYVEHKINGTSIVTLMAMDSKNSLWYVDPLTKTMGNYDPSTNINKQFAIPNNVTPSGITIDSSDRVWITSPTSGEVLVFDPQIGNITRKLPISENKGTPFAIVSDPINNLIWLTDEAGKLAKIDPANNYSITEYSPSGNQSLQSPTALLIDKMTGEIYISQHDGHKVTSFDPLTRTFTDLPIINESGLPFGMAFDKYGNLWVAEHTINKIAVIDAQKLKIREVTLENSAPFVQWLTSDSSGNIWFAEQRGNSLGMIESSAGPVTAQPTQESSSVTNESTSTNVLLSLSYQNFIAPAILVVIVLSAFMYVRSIHQLKYNMANLVE